MAVDRLSITLDVELGRAVREEAARSQTSVSGWLSEAAAARVRNERLGQLLREWEAEHGPPSAEDMRWAREVMGVEDEHEQA